jgi:O-antigen ligase
VKAWSLAGICAVLFGSVLTTWVPERWPVSILEVGSFVLAIAWLVRLAVSGERPRLTPVLIPLAALAGWGVLQLAMGWTVAASDTVRLTLTWAANLALVFACLQTFAGRGIRRRFLDIVLWFAVVISVAAIVQSFTAGGKILWLFPERNPVGTMGPVPYHTHFAVFVEAILPLALIAALDDARKRLWTSFMSAVMIAAVIVSASRGGFVMLVLEVAGVIALHEWRKRRGWMQVVRAVSVILVTIVLLTAMAGWSELFERLRQPDPYAGRREMLLSSIAMARDHFWTGVGLGCWPAAYPHYAIYDDGFFANQAHGDWGQFAGEAGIVGLAAFGGLFLLTLRRAIGNVWCLGLVCVFIHAFFDYPFQKPQIAALVLALLAAAES